jgi:5-formyltetrahydrofolate cyclo-ligase
LDIRRQILSIRDSLSRSEISRLSRLIHKNLFTLPSYLKSQRPLLFYSFRSEVETVPLIEKRLREREKVLLPKTLIERRELKCYLIDSLNHLRPGAYGIMEPDERFCEEVDPSTIDVVIVPGSVFDRRGGRYGYGGGYYDRFLSMKAGQAVRIALAFSFQVLENIPLSSHDELMNFVVTEKEIIDCGKGISGGIDEKEDEI